MKLLIGNIWIFFLLLKNCLRKRKELKPESIHSVLVIELSRMGDVISMIKAIVCLVENFFNSTISFVVDEKYTNLLKDLLEYHKIDLSRVKIFGFKSTDTVKGLRNAKKQLENNSYDLICSMSPSFRNGYLALSLRSLYKIGFFRSYSIYTPFLTKNRIEAIGIKNFTSYTFKNENIEERGNKICNALGITHKNFYKKHQNLKKKIEINDIKRPYIIIHPFAGWKYRSWNYLNYAELIKTILSNFEINIVLIGSPDEKSIGKEIVNIVGQKNIFLLFERELNSIVSILPNAELFIGNDSGPMHLASFFDVPSIGLYGPAQPSLTAPQKSENYYFYKKVDCSPCTQVKCIRPNNTCMDQISVEEVSNKVIEFLKLNLKLYL